VPERRVEHLMGMPIGVEADAPAAAIDALFDWLRWVDATFSTFRADSEIERLNAGELTLERAHPHVREVLDRCARLRVDTNGAFDAWAVRPGAVDPSGLVKGWAVERGAALLRRAGARHFAVNAGGDVRLGGGPWRVGVQHPRRADAVAAVACLHDGAIATSGAYERGEHIVDPRRGAPARGALSVTVVGPDLGTADAYATAAFALGRDGPEWTRTLTGGYEALTILDDERVLRTAGFPLVFLTMTPIEMTLICVISIIPVRCAACRPTPSWSSPTTWPATAPPTTACRRWLGACSAISRSAIRRTRRSPSWPRRCWRAAARSRTRSRPSSRCRACAAAGAPASGWTACGST